MEYLFLCLIGVYLFYLFVNTTMFKIEFPANFERDFLRVFAFTACARAFGRGKADRKLMAGIGLLILFGIVFSVDQYYFLLYLGYGMLGCIDIDYRKVLKIYTIETGCLIFITVVAEGIPEVALVVIIQQILHLTFYFSAFFYGVHTEN